MGVFRYFAGAAACLAGLAALGQGAAAPVESSVAVWVTHQESRPTDQASVRLRYPAFLELPAELVIDCDIETEEAVDTCTVRLTVFDSAGETAYMGSVAMGLAKGLNPCRFRWPVGDLPDGDYTAEVRVTGVPHPLEAAQSLEVRKLSTGRLGELFAAVDQDVAQLRNHLDRHGADAVSPYVRTGLALTEDYMKVALEAYASGDWRYASDVARYVMGTAQSARVALTFGNVSPERGAPFPMPAGIAVQPDGAVYRVHGAPAILTGIAAADPAQAQQLMPIVRQYGLNLMTVSIAAEAAIQPAAQAAVRDLIASANAEGVSLVFFVAPGGAGADYGAIRPETAERHRQAVAALAGIVRGDPAVLGLSVAHVPSFHMEGESVRQGFVSTVRASYENLDDVNRIWRSRYRSFDAIELLWDRERPAYQYDLQTYHKTMATRYVVTMQEAAEEAGAATPVVVSLPTDAFEPHESRRGIDRDVLFRLFPMNGMAALDEPPGEYAIPFPAVEANYQLARSIAPNRPVVNVDNRILFADAPRGKAGYRYVHATVWDQAMAGLVGVAMPFKSPEPAAPGVMTRPEWLDGLSTAHLDLNRLAPIVDAFASDVSPVAVLWSNASKLYGGGKDYLESALGAYEGAAFFGFGVRFITEDQCARGELENVKALIIPEAPALPDAAFDAVLQYIEDGGVVIRQGRPVPYDELGTPRRKGIPHTENTRFVRSQAWADESLSLLDSSYRESGLPLIPRTIDHEGYPIHGLKSRYTEIDGQGYLYVCNLLHEPMPVHLTVGVLEGRDLIAGQWVRFPMTVDPAAPMLVRVEPIPEDEDIAVADEPLVARSPLDTDGVPVSTVESYPFEEDPAPARDPIPTYRSKGRPSR